MMSFISSVQQMAAQLTDLQLPISELQVISKVLMSLPANYLHFVSAWDSVPAAEKTITLLISRLLKEEKMTNIRSQNKPNPSDAAYFSGTQEQSCMLYLSGFFFFLLFFCSYKLNNCTITTQPHLRIVVAIEETVDTLVEIFVETMAVIPTAEGGNLTTPDLNAHINIVGSQATQLTSVGRESEMKVTTKILDIHQPSLISQPEGVDTNKPLSKLSQSNEYFFL